MIAIPATLITNQSPFPRYPPTATHNLHNLSYNYMLKYLSVNFTFTFTHLPVHLNPIPKSLITPFYINYHTS